MDCLDFFEKPEWTKSNVQPPKKQARLHLRWLERAKAPERGPADPRLFRLLNAVEAGLGDAAADLAGSDPVPPLPAPNPSPTPDPSEDVLVMLAAAEFWSATRIDGAPWDPRIGVPSYTVWLEAGGSHVGRAIAFAAYRDAARAVPAKVDPRPDRKRQIRGEAAFPHYYFGGELGLRDKDDSCLLLDVVPAVLAVTVQRIKQRLKVPRANDQIFGADTYKPVIDMPLFTAFPGGHAAIAHALAVVLAHVTGKPLGPLVTLADRIAENREFAGLHTTFDTREGRELGRKFGRWMIDAAGHPAFEAWTTVFTRAKAEWPVDAPAPAAAT